MWGFAIFYIKSDMSVSVEEENGAAVEKGTIRAMEISLGDVDKTKAIFDEVSHRTKDCAALVAALAHKVKGKEMTTAKVSNYNL